MSEMPAPEELRWRTSTQLGVSFPSRTIELVVMPYEEEAFVAYGSRMVTEVISRGAFDGIERRPNRIRVNRDHLAERTVGRAVALHPSRDEGLVAELRIARTDLGDETLALADEGCLDASAGFLPMPGGEQWEERSRVRIRKAWLGHIAMTPDPAYVGANVLAVRNGLRPSATDDVTPPPQPSTPNLDIVRAWKLEERYNSLDS
jgi:HK97 family phage prohead protease